MDNAIGHAAGNVYRYLEGNGPATASRIRKATGLKDSTLHMAIGWLAREAKVHRSTNGRSTEWVVATT